MEDSKQLMQSPEENRSTNLLKVIYLGCCFLVLMTAFCAAQSLLTQIYRQLGYDNLGQICFFSMYFGMIIASLISTHYYKKLSIKIVFVLGAITHMLFVLAGGLTTYCAKFEQNLAICSAASIYSFNITSAGIRGVGTTFFWLAQSMYVNTCADEKTRGSLNGVFWSFMQTSQVLSGVLATFILGYTDQFVFYITLLGFCGVGIIMFAFLPHPPKPEEESSIMSGERNRTLSQSFREFGRVLKSYEYYYVFATILFLGAGFSFYLNFLGPSVSLILNYETTANVNKYTGLLYIILAVGAVCSGITMGRLADKYDKTILLGVSMIFFPVALALSVSACLYKSYPLIITSAICWGYGDTALNTMIGVVIGSRWKANPALFSSQRFLQSFGSLFSSIFNIFFLGDNPYLLAGIVAGSFLLLQVVFCCCRPKDYESNEGKEEEDLMTDIEPEIVY